MSDLLRPSDSAHPSDETLAGLVDGTLTVAERTELQAHLDGCERCRAQVRSADSASKALRSLPELDAPWGLGRAAIEEARTVARPARSRRIAAAAGIAAAAVIAVGVSVAVLRGPQQPRPEGALGPHTSGTSSAAGGTSDKFVPSSAPRPQFLRSAKNYSADDVAHLATSYSARVNKETGPRTAKPLVSPAAPPQPGQSGLSAAGVTGNSAATGTSGAFSTSGESGSAGAPASSGPVGSGDANALAADPVACLDTAAGYSRSTTPVQVIDARYEEKPALIGIFLRGPGANQPADLVVVWVASKECTVLTYASHRITP